ncbi:uncharacterized protein PSANT_01406 [Moesziomyces antarcticus]|uniref:Uncharacterized protein n=1 Tax=Pseudozyma antarctica TaxID=84753 RepID=A0A5C3FJM2_PSEA2|nr:uncharacterized protein PSANT_01406 [Moesziomyces antarcticus]
MATGMELTARVEDVDEESSPPALRTWTRRAHCLHQGCGLRELTARVKDEEHGSCNAELKKTISWLCKLVKRLQVRDRQFSDFVEPKFRKTSDVPKNTSKLFLRRTAEKLVSMYKQYCIVANLPKVEKHLLRVFKLFIANLTDCFDHPKEVLGWNRFAALASLRRRVQLHRANGSNFTSSDDGSNRDDNEDRNKNQDDRRLKASERSDNKLALDPMLN